MPDFALIATPGAYQSSIGALLDSFTLAQNRLAHVFSEEASLGEEVRLHILSADGRAVTLSDGRPFNVDGPIGSESRFDFIWLPAFRAGGYKEIEERLAQAGRLTVWLAHQAQRGAVIGGSGASALLLMAAKLTEGRSVPIARALLPLARTLFPRFQQEERLRLVDYGDLLIANGIANDLHLIVKAMERTLSPEVGNWLTSVIGLDRQEEEMLSVDPLVATAQLWLEQRFTETVSISALASSLSTTHPTLIRRFRKALGITPKTYVQQLRLRAAQRMLETSNRTIEQIAAMVGFSDSRLFRMMFREYTGMTASAWRELARANSQKS